MMEVQLENGTKGMQSRETEKYRYGNEAAFFFFLNSAQNKAAYSKGTENNCPKGRKVFQQDQDSVPGKKI